MQVKRVIVLDSDGESYYKYDYQFANGVYFVEVYKDGVYWYRREVSEYEFNQAEKEYEKITAQFEVGVLA